MDKTGLIGLGIYPKPKYPKHSGFEPKPKKTKKFDFYPKSKKFWFGGKDTNFLGVGFKCTYTL